jgi:hypothetical protein
VPAATFEAVLDGIECSLKAHDVPRVRIVWKDGRLQTMFVDVGPDHRTAMNGAMAFRR